MSWPRRVCLASAPYRLDKSMSCFLHTRSNRSWLSRVPHVGPTGISTHRYSSPDRLELRAQASDERHLPPVVCRRYDKSARSRTVISDSRATYHVSHTLRRAINTINPPSVGLEHTMWPISRDMSTQVDTPGPSGRRCYYSRSTRFPAACLRPRLNPYRRVWVTTIRLSTSRLRPVWVPPHQPEDRSRISRKRTCFAEVEPRFSTRGSPDMGRHEYSNFHRGRYVRVSDVLGLPVLCRTTCPSQVPDSPAPHRSERRWEPTLQQVGM
ncbi:hypothetical protein K466DRAFT_146550 [Polyporus arcularius HHB13444]|uniref:Uncharacterized protein n=1 Tax=Polyporus arcularius HHB13444 TaxID=1314778 RepID=A0A5C3Q459_9APHY|nr:hypothetical protein K466DRAFT_146550 [Polyporus arcularius HHB13444]